MQPRGSICALITPFDATDAVDLARWDDLLALHREAGTSAVVVGGSTGESGALEGAELVALIRRAVEQRGDLAIWAGVGAVSTAKCLQLAEKAQQAGAQALLAVTPYYSRPTQSGLLRHYLALADAVSVPIVLYNVPPRTGCDLLPETVAELVGHPRIVGIKDAVADAGRLQALLAMRDSQSASQFAILSGDDETAADWINGGADGVVSVAANVVPQLFARMSALGLAGDHAGSSALNQRLQPLHRALTLAPNPIAIKWLAARMGLCGPALRLPLTELETRHESPLAAAFDRAIHD